MFIIKFGRNNITRNEKTLQFFNYTYMFQTKKISFIRKANQAFCSQKSDCPYFISTVVFSMYVVFLSRYFLANIYHFSYVYFKNNLVNILLESSVSLTCYC